MIQVNKGQTILNYTYFIFVIVQTFFRGSCSGLCSTLRTNGNQKLMISILVCVPPFGVHLPRLRVHERERRTQCKSIRLQSRS